MQSIKSVKQLIKPARTPKYKRRINFDAIIKEDSRFTENETADDFEDLEHDTKFINDTIIDNIINYIPFNAYKIIIPTDDIRQLSIYLYHAVQAGNLAMAKKLLSLGADPNMQLMIDGKRELCLIKALELRDTYKSIISAIRERISYKMSELLLKADAKADTMLVNLDKATDQVSITSPFQFAMTSGNMAALGLMHVYQPTKYLNSLGVFGVGYKIIEKISMKQLVSLYEIAGYLAAKLDHFNTKSLWEHINDIILNITDREYFKGLGKFASTCYMYAREKDINYMHSLATFVLDKINSKITEPLLITEISSFLQDKQVDIGKVYEVINTLKQFDNPPLNEVKGVLTRILADKLKLSDVVYEYNLFYPSCYIAESNNKFYETYGNLALSATNNFLDENNRFILSAISQRIHDFTNRFTICQDMDKYEELRGYLQTSIVGMFVFYDFCYGFSNY